MNYITVNMSSFFHHKPHMHSL